MPVGSIITWASEIDPDDSFLECNGQIVDSSKYPKLYTLMHNVPDYRGVFLRGLGGNSAALGVLQNDAIRNITGNMIGSSTGSVGIWDAGSGVFSTFNTGGNSVGSSGYWWSYVANGMTFDASRVVPTAEENRPINRAVRYFIKAK